MEAIGLSVIQGNQRWQFDGHEAWLIGVVYPNVAVPKQLIGGISRGSDPGIQGLTPSLQHTPVDSHGVGRGLRNQGKNQWEM